MCMQANAVRPYQRWNWSGDEIVQSSTIPAARRVPNSRTTRYPIDIREFLSIEDNAVVRKWLLDLVSRLPEKDQLRFLRRGPGNFDFRAQVVAAGLRRLDYIASRKWLFREETLARKGGDCEDLAFVLAALLAASGISPYCIRLALGRIVDRTDPRQPEVLGSRLGDVSARERRLGDSGADEQGARQEQPWWRCGRASSAAG
jgi:hypothetical protein